MVQGRCRLSNPKSTGTKLFSVCGNVARPGNYEVVMGFPFKDFLYDLCGGPLPGRKFKAIIPGGSSVPIQTMEEAEATLMDYEGFVAQGTMLGSGGVIVFDDAQNLAEADRARWRASTPTRAARSARSAARARRGRRRSSSASSPGEGTFEDLDTLLEIAENMTGKTICVLSDSCAAPVVLAASRSSAREFEALIKKQDGPSGAGGGSH